MPQNDTVPFTIRLGLKTVLQLQSQIAFARGLIPIYSRIGVSLESLQVLPLLPEGSRALRFGPPQPTQA